MSRPTDPLAGSTWSAAGTVASFAQSLPNATLMAFAERELRLGPRPRALDVGCGAGRNAVPLARLGWQVTYRALAAPTAPLLNSDTAGDWWHHRHPPATPCCFS